MQLGSHVIVHWCILPEQPFDLVMIVKIDRPGHAVSPERVNGAVGAGPLPSGFDDLENRHCCLRRRLDATAGPLGNPVPPDDRRAEQRGNR